MPAAQRLGLGTRVAPVVRDVLKTKTARAGHPRLEAPELAVEERMPSPTPGGVSVDPDCNDAGTYHIKSGLSS
jgi:hypothetical protein